MKRFWAYALLVVLAVPLGVAAGEGALTPPKPAPFTATGGTVTAPVVFTGDNANGTGTVRIRPSDEDTQIVLCEASNNASPEVCTAFQHYNLSSTYSSSFYGTNLYLDSAGASQVYNTTIGSGYFQNLGTNTAGGIYAGVRHPGGAINFVLNCASTSTTSATCAWGSGHTTTMDFRGPLTNAGSATCNGVNAGSVCVNDQPVFYDSSATFAAQFGSSAANSSTQIWEYTQGTAGQATTLFATGTMASPTVVVGVGYYGSTYADADYADKAVLSGVGKEIVSNRTDNVAAGSVHSRWIDDSSASATLAGTTLMTFLGDGTLKPTFYGSQSNCSDGAGAAACSAAPAGSFVVDNGTTSTVVSTTAVTANSQILIQFDAGLGAKLGVTCNTNATNPYVTARTAGTSFTVQAADPAGTDPACFSYFIVN